MNNTTMLAALALVMIFAAVVFLVRRVAPTAALDRLSSADGFAAIVVSEIRMYHGRAVNTAFEQSAIYRSFKVDIDRARDMFLQRFPTTEAAFYGALVRILAQGEPDRLGAEYPYSRKAQVKSSAETASRHPPPNSV